jgi:hypothetical protein
VQYTHKTFPSLFPPLLHMHAAGRADEVDAVMSELTKLRSKMDAMQSARNRRREKGNSFGKRSRSGVFDGLVGASSPATGHPGTGGGEHRIGADGARGAGTFSSTRGSYLDDLDSSGYVSSEGSLRTSSSDWLLPTPSSSMASMFDMVRVHSVGRVSVG